MVSPPLLLGAAAWLVGVFKRAPFVFHVQDLQPDAAVGLGMLQAGWFTRILYWLEAFAYKQAARVSGISEEILDAFRHKGVPSEKLILFPNGVALPSPDEIPARGKFREKQGFAPDEFLAIYAGNLGVKQGLYILLDAAAALWPGLPGAAGGRGRFPNHAAKRLGKRLLPEQTSGYPRAFEPGRYGRG